MYSDLFCVTLQCYISACLSPWGAGTHRLIKSHRGNDTISSRVWRTSGAGSSFSTCHWLAVGGQRLLNILQFTWWFSTNDYPTRILYNKTDWTVSPLSYGGKTVNCSSNWLTPSQHRYSTSCWEAVLLRSLPLSTVTTAADGAKELSYFLFTVSADRPWLQFSCLGLHHYAWLRIPYPLNSMRCNEKNLNAMWTRKSSHLNFFIQKECSRFLHSPPKMTTRKYSPWG